MSKERVQQLKDACAYAIKRWPINGDTTYCNVAVHHIAAAMGYTGFRGMIANDMVDHMSKSPDFAKVSPVAAQALANDGKLVVSGIRGDAHGHVAVCYPGELFYSKKWRQDCPIIANVGKTNGVMSASWGFEGAKEPAYFAWIEAA